MRSPSALRQTSTVLLLGSGSLSTGILSLLSGVDVGEPTLAVVLHVELADVGELDGHVLAALGDDVHPARFVGGRPQVLDGAEDRRLVARLPLKPDLVVDHVLDVLLDLCDRGVTSFRLAPALLFPLAQSLDSLGLV